MRKTFLFSLLNAKDGNLPCSCLQSFHPSSLSDDCQKHHGMGRVQNLENVLPPLVRSLPLSTLAPKKCHNTGEKKATIHQHFVTILERKRLPLTKKLSQYRREKCYHRPKNCPNRGEKKATTESFWSLLPFFPIIFCIFQHFGVVRLYPEKTSKVKFFKNITKYG